MDEMKKQWSDVFETYITVHKETHKNPQLECFRCGKLLKSFYVVQDAESGVELAYLGTECIKHI